MTLDLNEVAVFIKVVEAGSFSQAAKHLGMPNSTVSSKVSSLEKRLGTTLIQRTTRKLNITPAGRAYFNKCLQGLQEIQTAEAELASIQGEPQGLLRITAPVELGSTVLPSLISDFTKKYSKVKIEVLLGDRKVDLLSENVDLAIRAGELKDSTLIAKKIGEVYFAPFASSKYLKTAKAPQHPKDLAGHPCIQFTPFGNHGWKLIGPKNSVTVPLDGKIVVNDLNMIKNLATNGNGIALLPTFFCYEELKAGKLVRLLPEWRTQLAPVHFVYAAQKFVTPKLSAFISMASESLKESLKDFNAR